MSIHPTAIIDPGAKISKDVEIGPYAVIEGDVTLGPRVKIWGNAYICRFTEIGEDSEVHMGAVIGHFPQDLVFRKKNSRLIIGKRNIIREYATIHRGTKQNSATVIGDDNFIMGFAHIGHNCVIGNNVVIANAAALSGYVEAEDRAFISGYATIHQFVRIGAIAMVAAQARVGKDIPPYMLAKGDTAVYAPNLVGLRKAGFSQKVRADIKKAYKILYRSGLNISEAIEKLEGARPGKEIRHLLDFLKKDSKRGICQHI